MARPSKLPPLTPAQSALAAEHYRLIRWSAVRMSSRMGRPWLYDEMVDVATEALVKAARAFDPERGVRFSGFFSGCLRGELSSRAAYRRRDCRASGPMVWLDGLEDHPDEPAADSDPVDEADDDRFALLLAPLGQPDRQVLQLRLREGWTLLRIGRQLGLTKQRVRQIQLRAVAKLTPV